MTDIIPNEPPIKRQCQMCYITSTNLHKIGQLKGNRKIGKPVLVCSVECEDRAITQHKWNEFWVSRHD